MIPSRSWGEVNTSTPILCLRCVEFGDFTPPKAVVIKNGESLCLDHAITGVQKP